MTATRPTRRGKAAALARDTRITKALRSIEADYQAQNDVLQRRIDAAAFWQRRGYGRAVLDAMKRNVYFESFKVLEEIRKYDALFAEQMAAVADDVGRRTFLHHRYCQAIYGAMTTAAAVADTPAPHEDKVDEFLLDLRYLNHLWRRSTDPDAPPDYLVGTVFAPERDAMRVKEA